ncbi:hypothetical protein C0J52_03988 [Blattella germanica]|nr:hypothetical protein C0J52_03988 [Blattella germanica]
MLFENKRLHNTELNDLYGKPDIIRTIKSHRHQGICTKWNNINDWKTLAQDRDVWRAYVRTAMNLRVR